MGVPDRFREFVLLVSRMRNTQREYFKNARNLGQHEKRDLVERLRVEERDVDQVIAGIHQKADAAARREAADSAPPAAEADPVKDQEFLIQELRSTQCRCRKRKKDGNTFCASCFYGLPKQLQNNLYRRIGEGYEEAREAAVAFLDGRG
jgi:hypothetical protein